MFSALVLTPMALFWGIESGDARGELKILGVAVSLFLLGYLIGKVAKK